MNIPSMLMSLISNSGADRSISTALGLTQEKADAAVTASVPSLLAAFSSLASTNQGAQQLANAAAQQDPGLLDGLANAFSTKGPKLADQGSNLLGSLLGGQSSMLGNILSRFTGVGEGAMGKLLGMLAPVVLGFLGKQAGGASASGLVSLLSSQKENIQSSMPSGLASMLSGSLPGIGNLFGASTDRPVQPPRQSYAPPTEDYSSRSRKTTGSPLRWVLPVAVLLALLAMLPTLMRRGRQAEVPPPATTPTVSSPTVRETTVPEGVGTAAKSITGTSDSASFVSDSTRLIKEATDTLAGVRDAASAEAAVPTLQDINRRLAGMKTTWESLPDAARGGIQSSLSPLAARFDTIADSTAATPAGNIIQPYVTELQGHFDRFTESKPSGATPLPK